VVTSTRVGRELASVSTSQALPSFMSFRMSSPSRSPTTTQNVATTPRNPITLRLRKVLGTNFTDQATTEALQTLSDLYSVPSTSVSAQQHPRGSGLDNSEDDDWSDLGTELTTSQERVCEHPDAPNETAARARKNLQRDLENKLAEGSQHFLKAFGEVDQVCLVFTCPIQLSIRQCLETRRPTKDCD
jgi:hypothetical protein